MFPDSTARAEYVECGLESRMLDEAPFSLLETLRFEPRRGFALLERHLDRLAASARFFDAPCDPAAIRRELERVGASSSRPTRVRLLLGLDGSIHTECSPLEDEGAHAAPVPTTLAAVAVDEASVWLHHKTTRREVYERALQDRPGFDDVVLWNRRGEVTESCVANVVVETPAGQVTPPLSSGLLAGTFRAELLARGEIRERVVPVEELCDLRRFFLVNSVRGWREALLVPAGQGGS